MYRTASADLVQILSINPINPKGKVASDAKRYELPYPVLAGRNSDIVRLFKLKTLPQLVIIDREGTIVFYKTFAASEEILGILNRIDEGKP